MGESVLQAARRAFGSILDLSPENLPAVDFVFCITLASRFPANTEPTWGFIIGPSGTGKSEAVLPFKGLTTVIKWCNAMTDKALISGLVDDTGEEHSYMKDLDGKLLLVEDWANISTMRADAVVALQAQLRSAYQGEISKAFGTGFKRMEAKFNILACTVPEIDEFLIAYQILGQRFMSLRLFVPISRRKAWTRHALRMYDTRHIWRPELQAFTAEQFLPAIDSLPSEQDQIIRKLPDEIQDRLVDVADLSALSRTLPSKINFSAHSYPLDKPPDAELATRLSIQLKTIGWARAYLDDRQTWTQDDLDFVTRIAWDSIPAIGQRLIIVLYRNKESTATQVSDLLRYSPTKLRSILYQYEELGLVQMNKTKRGIGSEERWSFTPDTLKSLQTTWGSESCAAWWPRISLSPRMEQ